MLIKFNHCGCPCWFNPALIAGVIPSPELNSVEFIIYGEHYTIHETFDEVMEKLLPAPFAPKIVVISPSCRENATPCNTFV